MFSVLLVLFVLETHHSASLSGLVVVCSQVPGIIVSPIAGALLDRGSRVPLMRLDYLVGSTCITTIGTLSVLHRLPTGVLLLVVSTASVTAPFSRSVGGRSTRSSCRGHCGTARTRPTRAFRRRHRARPRGSRVLVALVGPRVALFLPAIVMLPAAALLIGFVVPVRAFRATASVFADARAAIGYVWRNRVLRMLAGTMTVFNACGGILTVGIPFIVLREVHGGSTTVGLLFAIMGACGVPGRAAHWPFRNREPGKTPAGDLLHDDGGGVRAPRFRPSRGRPRRFDRRHRHRERPAYGGDVLASPTGHRSGVVRRAFAVSMNLNSVGSPVGASIAGALLTRSIPLTLLVAAVLCGRRRFLARGAAGVELRAGGPGSGGHLKLSAPATSRWL